MSGTPEAPVVRTARPGTPMAEAVVREYLHDVASRYYGRPATSAEVDEVLRDEPYADLEGDRGVLLVAVQDDRAVACAGARFVGDVAELTKVFTLPGHRGQGLGRLLVERVELICRERDLTAVRLDTRADLTEACALYERLGYTRVASFNDERYSDRWYLKPLRSRRADEHA